MVDLAVITRRLTALERYLHELKETGEKTDWKTYDQDRILQRYTERTLHLAIESCLDIANHIISYEGYREPTSNKDIFIILTEEGILEENLSGKLQKMAQFRNILVHDYLDIDPKIVYSALQNGIDDILSFAKTVQARFI